ncbi:arylsulfatase B-like [Oppia nitens]|uniref:arylsulfatase B-like n=1 Tax=Oppia nitens TaxID=1686743 RepID=UPI0023DA28FE|nr:arylsulfatase B-like [Oppia nitens]
MSSKYFDNCLFYFVIITIYVSIGGYSTTTNRPNVILLVADDLGWGDVGYRSDQILTPNIDTLAADGIVLNRYYTSPVCSPSRGALLTGVHPVHSGLQNYVILTAAPWGLPLDIKTLPEYLKDYGYNTHAIGKWHLGFFKREYTPTYRGFDSHVGYWSGSGDYFDHTALENSYYWGLDFRHNMDLITNATGVYSTHYFTDRAVQVIREHNQSRPLFLYMAYQAVHGANSYARLQAPQRYIDKFSYIKSADRRVFAAMTYAMDESIGILVDALKQQHMLTNSVIVFVSDNGGPASGFTGNAASNWPLRGVKATLWEGGIRVPAFIWSPLLNKTGYTSDALIHVTDLMPTVLEAIGADQHNRYKLTKKYPIYGVSQWSTLSLNQTSGRSAIVHNVDPIWNVSAIRSGDWKLIQGLVFGNWSQWYPPFGHQIDTNIGADNNSLITPLLRQQRRHRSECAANRVLRQFNRFVDYKVLTENVNIDCGPKPTNASVNCRPDVEHCLFNITADPCEYNNLAQIYPKVVDQLWHQLVSFNTTAREPGTQPSDPVCDPALHDYAWSCWRH